MSKKKLLVFHSAIAPYRIDLFNELNSAFEANFYFFREGLLSQKFDSKTLKDQLNFKPKFLTKGLELRYKGRMIRIGYLNKIIKHKPDVIIGIEYSILTVLSLLFSKLFFPHIKFYSICDDSLNVAENCSGLRKIARSICLKFLDGLILGNDPVQIWYANNFPNVKTVVFPIIQKEKRVISLLNEGEQIIKSYNNQFNLHNKKVYLFVGRLVIVKNLIFLIQAFADFVKKKEEAVLILVGDGNQKNQLINLAKKLNVKDKIIFPGRFESKELYAWYGIANYFVLPSTYEPFGAVVNEALICGVPVLCSSFAGASCLINEENGIIFDPYQQEDLLLGLNKLSKIVINKPSYFNVEDSLMPYTFREKIIALISFLQ